MVAFVVSNDAGVCSVWLDHGQAIDEYNRIVGETVRSGAHIEEERRASGDRLHETLLTVPDRSRNVYLYRFIRLERCPIQGRLLQRVK